MTMRADVLSGRRRWWAEQGDAASWLHSLPEGCADLLITSPPYEKARLYLEGGQDLAIARGTEAWVSWMVEVCIAARHACKGLCLFVVEGQTEDYRYSAGPLLLAADLHRMGFHLRKPPIFRRCGIPGSGGPDWWRNDWEFCLAFTTGGKLPWSDNTATGHSPKWAPGGEMSHRLSDGRHLEEGPLLFGDGETLPPVNASEGPFGNRPTSQGREPDGRKKKRLGRGMAKGTEGSTKGSCAYRLNHTGGGQEQSYDPPAIANPGNVVQRRYTAEEVAEILGEPTDVIDCNVGGGQMGSPLCHENEAPFPEDLVEPFVRCFCPPGGLVIDPFCGSGTTLAVALKWGRRALGCDLRDSQVELTRRRVAAEQTMFDHLLP